MPGGTRLEAFRNYYERYFTGDALDIVEGFVEAARQRGATPAQLAFAWVLSEPRVTCPIIGARNLEQFNDTIGGLDIELTPSERDAIPAVRSGHWVGKDPVYDRIY
jgi:aryl-alcohol dehydrogenase-like predicted oxidoreductase